MKAVSEAFPTNEIRCCLEKVGAMPKQGLASTWKFAEGYGVIQVVLKAFGIPYQTVPPQTWKKEFSLLHQDKSKSIETAQRLFPDVNFLPTERSRKPSDGMSESVLMAEFARRKL
jgi:crossover junction endodeoxyribonuclease RuvC